MRIGFTGTRTGMTAAQAATFAALAAAGDWAEFHHGDCVGADDQSVAITATMLPRCVLHLHPPTDERLRAHSELHHPHIVHPALPFLDRNAMIVAAADHLYACPAEEVPQVHGGTWWTVRHAKRTKVPVTVILPDGSLA